MNCSFKDEEKFFTDVKNADFFLKTDDPNESYSVLALSQCSVGILIL